MLTVKFKLTRSKFFAIWRRLQARNRSRWILPVTGVAILAFGVVISDLVEMLIGATLMAWWVVCVYVLVPRRLWNRFPQIREEQVVTFPSDGVIERLLHSESKYDWDHWKEITRAGDAYVMRSTGGMTFIPSRAFEKPADEERFRQLAAPHTRTSF